MSALTCLQWISENVTALGILGAAIAFSWSIVQYSLTRKAEQRAKDFEHYHKLIKELVQPESPGNVMWIERQIAIVFELRRFRFYHEVTSRVLQGLKEKWTNDPEFKSPRLIEEVDLTLKKIN